MTASRGLRLRQIHATALLLTALSLAVVLLSAYLRLDGAGLGCPDGPGCYGKLLHGEPEPQAFGLARLVHRLVASLFLLLTCYLAWLAGRRPSIPQAARPATLLLLLTLALAILGFWSADPRLLLVGFLNIIGGLALVSCSWRVVLASRPGSTLESASAPTLALRLGAVALSLTVILGALIGAGYAALACPSFPACGGQWWPPASGWAALPQSFARLAAAPHAGDAGAITLNLLHRWTAVGSLLLLGAAALPALGREPARPAALALLSLLVAETALGSLTVISGFSLWLAIGHGVGAALLLATLVTLRRR
ncbi:MAG: COX15/CtaA family protein [Rhodobacteraceae bacterium]|nr:COX15/CtaA family protein [Paracoccaceae bacterium]